MIVIPDLVWNPAAVGRVGVPNEVISALWQDANASVICWIPNQRHPELGSGLE
jgi:hypothetical protein